MKTKTSDYSKRVILILLLLTGILFVASFGAVTEPRPLVSPSEWRQAGQFPALADTLSPLQIPTSMSGNPAFRMFRSWTERGALKGTISSSSFKPAPYMAVPFQRGGQRHYPNPDEIYFRCESSGAKFSVSSAQSFDEWNVAYVHLPPSFCAGEVTLNGTSNATLPEAYLGIATPFEVSRATYLAHTGFGVKAAIVAATWFFLCAIAVASHVVLSRFNRGIDPLATGIVGIGAAGMAVFTAGIFAAPLSQFASGAIVTASIGLSTWWMGARKSEFEAYWRKARLPLLCWLAVSMSLTAFVAGIDNGGGRWAANAMFAPLSWSVDNENPIFFAYQFAHAAPGLPLLAGPWQFDDRTPLLTVLLIIPQTLFIEPIAEIIGQDFIYTADSSSAVFILAAWVPVIIWFAQKISVRHRLLFIAIVSASPFMLFNTVFTWGKIMGATYMVLAIGLMLPAEEKHGDRPNLFLIPSALALSYLSHSGNAISAVAFLLVFWSTLRIRDTRTLISGTIAALAIMAPWLYWIKIVQPGGNALTRLQLADDVGFNDRSKSVLLSMKEKLRSVGWQQWLALKKKSFHIIGDVPGNIDLPRPIDNRTADYFGNQRSNDFVVVARTTGISTIGVIAALFQSVFRVRQSDPLVLRLIICGLLGIVSMTLVIIQIGVVHHQAYGSVIMLAIAGAIFLANRKPLIPVSLFAAWCVYFVLAWVVGPMRNADHLHPVTLCAALIWGLAAIYLVSTAKELREDAVDHTILWKRPDAGRDERPLAQPAR
ncbi:hypothetical protein [Burkholderia ubonensis]|uniref:Putative membrane protein n=1 Tax=Burkholderia ubonensis TaxID=101571 RepID=G3FNC6_9BURK|nr:hypothetical protein [Burkholderia ubonensis]AEO78235.1 putative membrane protein [Burkholderia ubonensis]